jgi:threonine synthase
VDTPETVATAIRIGNPASWDAAIAARDESGGRIDAVTDDEILAAYRMLAGEEGVFCEPASAAPVAGILKFREELPEGVVVCTLTGHGLKDPDIAVAGFGDLEPIPPTLDAVLRLLDW